MNQPIKDKFLPLIQELQDFSASQISSITIFRVLGYGLLILAVFDWVAIIYPPNFMNPSWEFQTLGTVVERIPVSLIGFVLVFFGELYSRTRWERIILKILSWLTLLLTLIFLLMIPLIIGNTVRLNNQNITQVNNLSKEQIARAEQLEKQITEVTPEQLNNFLKSQGRSLDGRGPDELKNQLLSEVSKAKQEITNQAQSTQSTRALTLIKSGVKWSLGAIVSSALFFVIWKETKWARN
jgi:CBS domain containing-hemolysin-like protein